MCLSIAIDRPHDVLETGEHLGFKYHITNNGSGYRCGYVRVPEGHPWFGKGGMDLNCQVHGGITFGKQDIKCSEADGKDWWVGFDCAHAGDLPDPNLPGYDPGRFNLGEMLTMLMERVSSVNTVRTQEYTRDEVFRLCEQAKSAA